jgi:hypothetical protein
MPRLRLPRLQIFEDILDHCCFAWNMLIDRQPVPDEQHEQRADGRAEKTCAASGPASAEAARAEPSGPA